MSIEYTQVFVGRDKELQQLVKFLQNKSTPAMVIMAETGMGKSSFLAEVVKQIKEESASTNRFVGLKIVEYGTTNAASPFIGVIDDLMENLKLPLQEKISEGRKRVVNTFKKILSEKGKQFAKSIAKTIALKWLSKEQIEQLEEALKEFKEEFESTQTIENLAEKTFSEHRNELVQDVIFFFKKLTEEYETLDFVLVIDQFERAPLTSYKILLSLVAAKIQRLHIIVSIKMQKEGMENYDSIKEELYQLDTEVLPLPPMSYRTIGEWILKTRKKEFSDPQLKRIRLLSGGFPFLIARWLMHSENLEINELNVGREGYCRFIEWCFEGLSDECWLFLRKISVLTQPLSVGDYEKLTGTETGECSLLLEKLEKKWILIKQEDSFWFRHDLIKPCIENKLSSGEKHSYHMDAAKFFKAKCDHQEKEGQVIEFRLMLCCAYHFHYAGEYEKSIYYNGRASDYSFHTGDLDVAEACYLRIIEAAQKLGKTHIVASAKANLAPIYQFWGRLDEARKTNLELIEYFKNKNDTKGEAVSLHNLAVIEQAQGNIEQAKKLYNDSLEIKQEIGDKQGMAQSLCALGVLFMEIKRPETALENLLEGACLFRQIGSPSEKIAIDILEEVVKMIEGKKLEEIISKMPEHKRQYVLEITEQKTAGERNAGSAS